MSRQLLNNLNGDKKGAFHRWLSTFKGEPRIAWYPSAGEDFRDLLYLNPKFAQLNPALADEPTHPDLFLHSDYYPWSTVSSFLDKEVINFDNKTRITVKSIEELPRCDLPLDPEIVDFPKGSHATGRALFFEVEVSSRILGSFSCPVIYVFAENSAFCAERILPSNGKFSHIIHIRYGGGCGGGGKSTGIWLLNILERTGCECFVTNNRYSRQDGDERVYQNYPDLKGPEETSRFVSIRNLPSKAWSEYGDVSWNIIKPV